MLTIPRPKRIEQIDTALKIQLIYRILVANGVRGARELVDLIGAYINRPTWLRHIKYKLSCAIQFLTVKRAEMAFDAAMFHIDEKADEIYEFFTHRPFDRWRSFTLRIQLPNNDVFRVFIKNSGCIVLRTSVNAEFVEDSKRCWGSCIRPCNQHKMLTWESVVH